MQELSNFSIQALNQYTAEPVAVDCILRPAGTGGGMLVDWSCLRDLTIVRFNSMFFWLAIFLLVSLFLRIYWNSWLTKYVKHQKTNDIITGIVTAMPDGFIVILCVQIIYYGGMFLYG